MEDPLAGVGIPGFSVDQRKLLSTILRESFLGTEKIHFGAPATLGGSRGDLGVIWQGLEVPCGPRVRFGGHFGPQMPSLGLLKDPQGTKTIYQTPDPPP